MEIFEDTGIEEPVFLRNLIIYPIYGKFGNGFNPTVIEEVLKSGSGIFCELDNPDIGEIIFENSGNSPVLMLDGEEVTGSLQNRIITQSNIVEARSAKNIPVVCVEEGRWDEIGGFKTGYCSYPRLRSVLLKSRQRKVDTQQIIWNEISRKLTITKTWSTTSSMHDIYDNLNEEVLRYVEDFKSLNHHTVGFIGIAGNRILGCDIFQNPSIYQKFENKLIRSYALDAIEYQKVRGNLPDVEFFFNSLCQTVNSQRSGKKKSNVSIKGKNFLSQALMYQDAIVHLSAFPR